MPGHPGRRPTRHPPSANTRWKPWPRATGFAALVDREFSGRDFRDEDLSRLRTERAVFSECDFSDANLAESDHRGIGVLQPHVRAEPCCALGAPPACGGHVCAASTLGSVFVQCRMRPMTFDEVDFMLAVLGGNDLRGVADLGGCRLAGGQAGGAILPAQGRAARRRSRSQTAVPLRQRLGPGPGSGRRGSAANARRTARSATHARCAGRRRACRRGCRRAWSARSRRRAPGRRPGPLRSASLASGVAAAVRRGVAERLVDGQLAVDDVVLLDDRDPARTTRDRVDVVTLERDRTRRSGWRIRRRAATGRTAGAGTADDRGQRAGPGGHREHGSSSVFR